MLLVALFLLFISISFFMYGIYYYVKQRRYRMRILDKIKSGKAVEEQRLAIGPDVEERHSVTGWVTGMLGALGERTRGHRVKDLSSGRLDFLKAGLRKRNMVAIFWGAKCLLAVLLLGVFLVLKPLFFSKMLMSKTLLVGCTLILFGFFLPNLWLKVRITERKRRIQEGLPDALDFLVMCVEAGMSLDAAIHRVGEEMRLKNKELSDELMLMNLEVRAGKLRRDALKSLALRTDLDDLNSLVSLLIQADKFGSSIASALRVYSDAFRTKRIQRAEEIANKLPIKLMFPLGVCIFPSIFVVIIGPAAIKIFHVIMKR
jgi:tight adherence protein C